MDQNDQIHAQAQHAATLAIEEWHRQHRHLIGNGAGLTAEAKHGLTLAIRQLLAPLIAVRLISALAPIGRSPKPAVRKRKKPEASDVAPHKI